MNLLARKKRVQEGGQNNAPWMNTFADLMNLLLCFFVFLFGMSTIDAEKFEKIARSLSESIGVFSDGGTAIGTGDLVSSGITQMNELGESYTDLNESSRKTGEDKEIQDDASDIGDDAKLSEALERVQEERVEVTTKMYEDVSELVSKYNLGEFVELSVDKKYQYVEFTLKGSILYDSGDAELRSHAKPILSRIGTILKEYEGYTVEITGHTDNVPMTSSAYRDNNWLSSARALNAAEYLIDNSGLDPTNLKYSGRGEYEPIASNSTEEGRAKNRRIEIKIYNAYSG